jgi:tetratricopeptide (TPR) repeat protein
VTTDSPEAQAWFDRGLVWCYGFNHEEGLVCFRRAADADPSCAMAHWGQAYALGPHYNKDWDAFEERELIEAVGGARLAVDRAVELAGSASPVERALIEALAARYPEPTPAEDCTAWSDAYAAAMRDVYGRHGDDPDVAALFAEALMNRTPWLLWDLDTGQPAEGADTAEIVDVLERAMAATDRPHPALLHLYVHAIEMSPAPERALPAADMLRDLVPDAGHLRHMPTHIDVLMGRYADVVTFNEAAIEADRKFLERAGPLNFYTLYRCHNYHFKVYGAMFQGRLEPAMEAADELAATLSGDVLRVEVPPMAEWAEAFVPTRLHVLVRFGLWQRLIDEPLPDDTGLYATTTTLLHYAKGVAYAATGDVESAKREREGFAHAYERLPESRYMFNNTSRDIMRVAESMLDGEIAYRAGDYDLAFEHLRRAVQRDDDLLYDEPWNWMQPTRHALGALLLEQGQVEEAAAIYRADLGVDDTLRRPCRHPGNVWSLHGYHECLHRLGRCDEADSLRPQLDAALAQASVPITASCFCRTTAHGGNGADAHGSAGGLS